MMQPRPQRSTLAVMQPGSHRDRIIEAIRISSPPLDDDQLAGLVRRRPGPYEKIVNEWLGNHGRQPDSVPAASDAGVSRTPVPMDAAAVQAAASCRRAARGSNVTLSG